MNNHNISKKPTETQARWEVNRAQTERFLRVLDPEASAFSFQTFDDSPSKRMHLIRVLHGGLAEVWDELCSLSQVGAGVFVTVNETNLLGRSSGNVVRVRALFADLDGAPLENIERVPLKPSWVTVSSEGRFHAYWLVENIKLDEFRPLQKAIIDFTGSDASVCDLPRVMRLPGFPHQKGEPTLVKGSPTKDYLKCNTREQALALVQTQQTTRSGKIMPFSGVFKECGEQETMKKLAAKTEHLFANAIEAPTAQELLPLVADMLKFVSSNVPRPEWWPHLAAMAHLAGGDEAIQREAEAICREWSSGFAQDDSKSTRYAGSTLYNDADFDKQWLDCVSRNYTGERTTWRSIRFAAVQGGWIAPQTSFPVFAKAEAASRSPDLVDVLNEQWAWLEDEQIIFDLKFMTSRSREQMMGATAARSIVSEGDNGKTKRVSGYNLWFTSPNRRQLAGRKFLPGHGPFVDKDIKGKPLGGILVNLWQGWGCEPVKGDVEPLKALISKLCGGDPEEIRYLTWRIAIKLQKPWVKVPSYVLIVTSAEGTGKSQLGKFIVGLYGKHGKIITDREVESSFDDWKADGILFAMSEEVSLKEKKSTANRLKAMTSMEVQQINPKGKPAFSTENYLDLYFTANDHNALYIRNDKERRPFIVQHDVEPMSMAEAQALQNWYDRGGKEAMLFHFLHEVDGDAFAIHAPAPLTSGKTLMAEASRSPAEAFVDELIVDDAEAARQGEDAAPLRDFRELLVEFLGVGERGDKRAEQALVRALTRAGAPRRRIRAWIEREGKRESAGRKTLYAVGEMNVWRGKGPEEWANKYLEQSLRKAAK
ncbi:primase-helicase family protein [Methylocapsa palsarum]|uniref:RepB DNA-primase n=1 Tax=Methylocapsa palsarum TaxID=1612308 RepID=A0A1I3WUK9_9HYPH|nr:primase-helicase family protein [Methylocapsa palsarum]SFK10111.1 hypothetical protein SAMN05444581_10289 [Methylocapsa palsarum]